MLKKYIENIEKIWPNYTQALLKNTHKKQTNKYLFKRIKLQWETQIHADIFTKNDNNDNNEYNNNNNTKNKKTRKTIYVWIKH